MKIKKKFFTLVLIYLSGTCFKFHYEINEPNHNCIIKNKTTELIETASFTSRNQQNRNNNTDGEKAT
jgi:hypothetical protein